MAERSIPIWRQWNQEFGEALFHEVGFLFLRHDAMKPGDFEFDSLKILEANGRKFERMTSAKLRQRYPAWNAELYPDGFLECNAGYVESGRAVAALIKRSQSLGVDLHAGRQFKELDGKALVLEDRERMTGDAIVFATGAWTPYLLPFTAKFFRASGQPVFHLKPSDPELFRAGRFPVFGGDISETGYYGFPVNRDGVVKVADHGVGLEMRPDDPNRDVTPEEEQGMRAFLRSTFPALADAPVVYTRRCFYCDTHDGDFWIARDPDREGLTIAAGDSGHGFKFAPVLGEIIADAVEGKENPLLKKFRWRPEVQPGLQKEAARFLPE
jgi:glycine/D-amino acid oxidase-like deaminating enzyme